jgi:hypothetical protein
MKIYRGMKMTLLPTARCERYAGGRARRGPMGSRASSCRPVRSARGRFSALSISHSESVFCGGLCGRVAAQGPV